MLRNSNCGSSSLQRATEAATVLHRSSNLVASWGCCCRLAPLLSVFMLQAGVTTGTGIMGARLDTGTGKRMSSILEVASAMFPLQIKIIHIPTWYFTGLGQSIGHIEQCWTVNVGHGQAQVVGLVWLDQRDGVDKIHQFTCTRQTLFLRIFWCSFSTSSGLFQIRTLEITTTFFHDISIYLDSILCRLCCLKWPLVQLPGKWSFVQWPIRPNVNITW